ncbi:MAG: hypothetical protein LBL36_05690 [Clostridiales Family XIII bacterium]|jgi:hypothetical protein|nr:hypothetical protein [Clostridiales Family XIII bacterium]
MGMTMFLGLFFVIGVALLFVGILYKSNRKIRLTALILGAVFVAAAVAMGLFLIFVLIPAM